MSRDLLETNTRTTAEAVHVTLHGELDLATVDRADETLRAAEAEGRCVVLDLSGLTFMDSTGLRLVLRAVRRSRETGLALRLVSAPPAVQRVFRLTGLESRLPFATV